MEDKKQNTGVIFPDDSGGQLPTSVSLPQDPLSNSQALSSDPVNVPLSAPEPVKKSQNVFIRLMRRADVILALLLVLGGIGLTWRASSGGGEAANTVTSRFETTEIPLQELITEQGIDFGTQSVTINGPLQLNDSFVIAPSLQPSNATAGQIYYDQASNILNYYNGTAFVPLVGSSEQSSSFQSVGAGLALNNGQLSNTGVLSLQGQTGNVTLTAGNGIGISGTTITNNGVVSLVSGNSTLVITDNGNGNLVLTVDVGGAGVTSLNGQAGALNLANASGASGTVTIDDASTATKGIAQFNGTNFQAASGVINTIQNINTGATPTFAGVNTNSITPSAALTVGATGQQLTLQGNASTQLTATGGGFTTTLGFAGTPVGNVTYNLDRAAAAGTYTICTTVGNCTGTGGGVSTSGGTTNRVAKFTGAQTIGDSSISDDGTNVTASSDLIIQGGDVTVGVVSTQTGTINLAHSGSSFLGSFVQGALTDNRQYLLPDAGGTVCLSTGNCSGSGSANTLQAAYDAGNTITTSNARNVAITMSDTATDSNFLINLECDTACGANGRFAIQDDAVDVFTISPAGGAVNFINAVDSTQAFNIEENTGGNLFTVDTVNSRIGINLGGNNVPTFGNGSAQGLVVNGALRVIGSTNNDTYLTPNGSSESARVSVQNYDVPQFGQVIAVGLTSGSHADARAIGVYDDRIGNHQPSVAVFDITENDAFGLSWEGSSTDAYLKTLGSDVNIRINTTDAANFTASSVNLLQNTSITGTLAVSAMGATDTSSYLCRNTLNQLSTCASSGAGSAFVQGGNSFTQTAILGTNDAFDLQIERGGATKLTVGASDVTLASGIDLLLQGAGAYISNPQGQTNAESFGLNATVGNQDALAVGNGADASGVGTIALGYLSAAGGDRDIAIGRNATTNTAGNAVVIGEAASGANAGVNIGQSSSCSNSGCVAIGTTSTAAFSAVALGYGTNAVNNSIALGESAATTAGNQFVVGSGSTAITRAVIGNGVTNATPTGFTLQGSSGSGTNIAGANVTVAAGQGTGSALGGNILFQSSVAGASGATLNGLTTLGTLSTTSLTMGTNIDILLQGTTAYFSNPQGQTNSEAFGLGATVAAGQAVALGSSAQALSDGAIAIGYNAQADSFGSPVAIGENAIGTAWGVAIGEGANSGSNWGVAVGNNAVSSVGAIALGADAIADSGGIAIGQNAQTNGNNRIALGSGAQAAADFQMVVGSSGSRIDHVVIGNGITNATPTGFTLQGSSGSGTNIAGANVTVAAGQGTGSALGGSIVFQSSVAGASGTGLNGLTTLGTLSTTSLTMGTNIDVLLQGSTAYFSNPQGQTASESFGLNATVSGSNAVAFGNGASAGTDGVALGQGAATTSTGSIAIGQLAGVGGGAFGGTISIGDGAVASSYGVALGAGATTTGNFGTALGRLASTGAQESVAIGAGASAAGLESIAIGVDAVANGADRIALGHSATTTAANQMVIGGSNAVGSYINHLVVGSGVTDTTPQGFRLQATSGSGTNIAGANLDIAAGQGTGSANGGGISFQISQPGASGTALNGLTTVGLIQGGTGAAVFTNAVNSTSAFNVENSSGSNLFTIDTVNSRVGINLGGNNTPTMNGDGLEVNGGVKVSGAGFHSFTTPLGGNVNADFSVNVQSAGDFTQIFAFGLDAASAASARGILVADARAVVHQPTIAVLSPNENEIGGFSWDGSNDNFLVKNTSATGTVGLNVGGTTRLQATTTGATVTGIAAVTTLGSATNSTFLCHNSSNQIAACSTTGGSGAAFIQGGNSFGQTATLGTNDGFGLNFEVNTTTVMTISTVGAVNLQNQSNSVNAFRIQNAAASATLVNADTTNLRVGIGGTASFSKFEVIDGDAAIYNSGANPRLIIGDSTSAGQNGFLQWDSTNDYLRIETTGTNGLKINDNFISIGNLFPDQPLKVGNGSTLLAQVNTTGEAFFQNSANANDAFQVLNASGVPIFTVDTADSVLRMGGTDTGIVMVGATNEPSSPAAGEIRIYGKSLGGRLFPKWKAPAGPGYAMQTAFFGASVGMVLPQSNGNVTNIGLPITFSGITWPNLASTNMHTSMKRNAFTTATTANAAAGMRSHESIVWRGNAAGLGGFFYSSRFAVSTTTTNQQLFVGFHDITGAIAGTAVPSNLTDTIGVGWDAADTNLQVMHNDSAGTATKINLGASFPANNTTAVYEVRFFASPNGSTVAYEVTRLDTGTVATGTISTNMPASATFLTQHMSINNGGTAAAATLDFMHVYVETDY